MSDCRSPREVLGFNHLKSGSLLYAFGNFWCVIVGDSFVYCYRTLILVLFLTLKHLAYVLCIHGIRHVTVCSHRSACKVKKFLTVRIRIIMLVLGNYGYLS
jgi:hypothetical protein